MGGARARSLHPRSRIDTISYVSEAGMDKSPRLISRHAPDSVICKQFPARKTLGPRSLEGWFLPFVWAALSVGNKSSEPCLVRVSIMRFQVYRITV